MSEANRRWSPFAYGNNNPVRFIDPDGRDVYAIIDGKAVLAKKGDGDHVFYDNGRKLDALGKDWTTVASSLNNAGRSTIEGLGNSEQAAQLRTYVGQFNSQQDKETFNDLAVDIVGGVELYQTAKYWGTKGFAWALKHFADDGVEVAAKKGPNLVEALSKVGGSRSASEFLGWGRKTTILKSASDFTKQQLIKQDIQGKCQLKFTLD